MYLLQSLGRWGLSGTLRFMQFLQPSHESKQSLSFHRHSFQVYGHGLEREKNLYMCLFSNKTCKTPGNIKLMGLNTEGSCCYCESIFISDNNESTVLLTLVSIPLSLLQILLFSEDKLKQFVKQRVFNDILSAALNTLFSMA